jgi:hypothetical protein
LLRQNAASASALAGIALEKIVNPAVNTKAETKNAHFFIERLLLFSHGHVAPYRVSQASCGRYAAHVVVTGTTFPPLFNVRRGWRLNMSSKRVA